MAVTSVFAAGLRLSMLRRGASCGDATTLGQMLTSASGKDLGRNIPAEADLGVSSWPPDAWQQGGGGLAGTPIYDAATGLLIYATGHPAPWNAEQRPGENNLTSGLFARDAATGAARWFVPINPHDLYGLGAEGSLIRG